VDRTYKSQFSNKKGHEAKIPSLKNKIFKTALGSQTSKSGKFNIFGTALTGLTTEEGAFSSTNQRRIGINSKNEALWIIENRDIQQINEFRQREEEESVNQFLDAKQPYWHLQTHKINREGERNQRFMRRQVNPLLTLDILDR
jgi:hypothetical protein